MGLEVTQLHVALFPVMAYGHMLPIIDIARLFEARGVKVTIITTTANAHVFTKTFEKTTTQHINVEIFKFPSVQVGLPDGLENFEYATTEDMLNKFMKAVKLLQEPLEGFLQEKHPNCIVADMFMPWVTDVAGKFNIPRLIFLGTSYFSMCVGESLRLYEPHKAVSSDDEQFVAPNLPDEIKLTKMMLCPVHNEIKENVISKLMNEAFESEKRSYGVIMNSFYELEPAYVHHHRNVLGKRSWHIGPVSLCNRKNENKAHRGKEGVINQHECLKWLDSKEPNSVIYLCFGSMTKFSPPQLHEIAMALEASDKNFIWVIRGSKDEEPSNKNSLPEGFEKRTEDRGLIIRGWAPQVLILDHESTGAFVTHCGWNSILEGISAGKPLVTWPIFAEQFYNEKLVTQILKVGTPVGSQKYFDREVTEVGVKRDNVEKALRRVMNEEDSLEIRNCATKQKEMTLKAVEEGGSSYSDLSNLIEELCCYHP